MTAPAPAGGPMDLRLGELVASPGDGRHRRSTLTLLARCLRRGWLGSGSDADARLRRGLEDAVDALWRDETLTVRHRRRALEVLQALAATDHSHSHRVPPP